MKTIPFLTLLSVLSMAPACEKYSGKIEQPDFSENSDKRLMMFALNREHQFYFVSREIDKDTVVPPWSSYLPMKFKLYRQMDTDAGFELIDGDFLYTEDMLFDSQNRMLVINHLGIFRPEGDGYTRLLEEAVSTFALDSRDVIWTGGYNTGLIKIGPDGEITGYTDSNPEFPANGISCICVDNTDAVWVALWNNRGILRIDDRDWQFFNPENSNLTSQNILAIYADHDNHVWIGTGHDDADLSLMRFDGTGWEDMSPAINGVPVKGAVRKIVGYEPQYLWYPASTISMPFKPISCWNTTDNPGTKFSYFPTRNRSWIWNPIHTEIACGS